MRIIGLMLLMALQGKEPPSNEELGRIVYTHEDAISGNVLQAALNALRKSATLGSKEHLPALGAIIEAHKRRHSVSILLEAVNAHHQLGGDREYLLRVLSEADAAGVYAVIWVLGREGNKDILAAIERELERRPSLRTSKILAALSETRACCGCVDKLSLLQTLPEKVEFLADRSLGTYSACSAQGGGPVLQRWYSSEYDLAPIALWAQREMAVLGEIFPLDCAKILKAHTFPSIARLVQGAAAPQVESTMEMLRRDLVEHMGQRFRENWALLRTK